VATIPTSTGGNTKKVLVIDDDVSFSYIIEFDLKKHGYQVIAARNGREGLEKIKGEKPDLVLLDVMMPEKTGYQLVEELKEEDESLRNIPVIILSGRKSFRDFFPSWTIHSYLDKGCPSDELIGAVKDAIGESSGEAVPAGDQGSEVAAAPPQKSGKKLLIVAVEDFILGKVKSHVEAMGYSVLNCVNEDGLLAKARDSNPDIIMAQFWEDDTLLDAIGIYHKLQEDPQTKAIPFTAFCAEHLGLDAVKSLGASNVLVYQNSDKLLKQVEDYLHEIA